MSPCNCSSWVNCCSFGYYSWNNYYLSCSWCGGLDWEYIFLCQPFSGGCCSECDTPSVSQSIGGESPKSLGTVSEAPMYPWGASAPFPYGGLPPAQSYSPGHRSLGTPSCLPSTSKDTSDSMSLVKATKAQQRPSCLPSTPKDTSDPMSLATFMVNQLKSEWLLTSPKDAPEPVSIDTGSKAPMGSKRLQPAPKDVR